MVDIYFDLAEEVLDCSAAGEDQVVVHDLINKEIPLVEGGS